MCALLEQNVDMFREEFAAIDPSQYQVDARDQMAGLTDGRNWTVFPFYDGYGNLQADNARKCPRIAEFLSDRAGIGRMSCMAFFSILSPKTHVPSHSSPLNVRARYHLGIEVPEGIAISVSTTRRSAGSKTGASKLTTRMSMRSSSSPTAVGSSSSSTCRTPNSVPRKSSSCRSS
jgi:aspartyl/asparaginyl beta-hydroxylase (cupin superfamily)